MTTHYFIQIGDGNPFGVTKEDFVKAERGAGFYPKTGMDKKEPCTAGFSANNIKGTLREVPQFFVPTVEEIEGIPAGSNPFHYDSWSMGSDLVRGWMAMHGGFDNAANPQPLHSLILINTRTGQRFRVTLNDSIELSDKVAGCRPIDGQPTKEGWMTQHPTSGKRVEVVSAAYVQWLEDQLANKVEGEVTPLDECASVDDSMFLTAIEGYAVNKGDRLYLSESRQVIVANSTRIADDGEVFIIHNGGEASVFECSHVSEIPEGRTHVDKFVDSGFGKNLYARWFFFLHRLAAIYQIDWREWIEPHKLFCTYQSKRFRVTGASRMGDIWLTKDFEQSTGYERRVWVNECSEFSSTPEVGNEAV